MRRALSDIRMRDPFLLDAGAQGYYLFGTTDENLWGGPGTGFDCYRSSDLESWDGPHPAFRPPAGFWGTTQFWAPEVHAHDGWFAMLATFADRSGGGFVRGTAVLRADEPGGPYLPWSDGPVTPPDLPCLDGTLHIDADGDPWIVYSRGAEGSATAPAVSDGQMWARRLTSDLRAAEGDPVLLFTASTTPWARPFVPPPGSAPPPDLVLAEDPYFTDGAFLFRSPDGRLRMLWSSWGEEGYAMGVATSTTGHVTGPWTQSDAPVWARNGGHGMLIEARGAGPCILFHAPNDTPNERARMVAVAYTDDGLSIVGDEMPGSMYPADDS